MKKLPTIARIFLGLIFFIFGLNGFLMFITPPPMSQGAMNLMMSFVESGYLLPFVKLTEVVCGALLLSGLFVPLALVMLAPIVLNIVALHLFLDPNGLPAGSIALLIWVYLTWAYRAYYAGLFTKKATPIQQS